MRVIMRMICLSFLHDCIPVRRGKIGVLGREKRGQSPAKITASCEVREADRFHVLFKLGGLVEKG